MGARIEVDSTRAWVIAGAAALTNGVAFGTVYTFGSFFKGMAESFDTGLGPTSIVFGITMFLFFGTGAVSGFLCDRIGPRPLVIAGGTLFCLGLLLTAQVSALWQGYFTYGVGLGLGGGLFTAPLFATVAGWFEKHRALAQGVTAAGNGIGTMLLVPLAKTWINSYGWRTAYRLLAVVCAVSFSIGAVLIVRSPVPPSFDGVARLKAASRSGSFRTMAAAGTLMSMALIPAFVFIIPFAEENGFSSAKAASIVMIVGGSSVLGRVALTRLSSTFGSVQVAQACVIAQPVAYVIWLLGRQNYPALVLFAVLLGIAYGGHVALLGEVTAVIYGVAGLGAVLGGVYFFAGLGSLIGPPTAGFLADNTSQPIAISSVLVISVIGSAIFMRLKPTPITLDVSEGKFDDADLDFRIAVPQLRPGVVVPAIPSRV
ncbi:MAG: MFS family permease [Candidatus Poriferisodalaceae bacterium]|jgi:MFS family permease